MLGERASCGLFMGRLLPPPEAAFDYDSECRSLSVSVAVKP